MLPRWHIILGALFSLILAVAFPDIPLIYIVLVFLSSFLIDVDHYLASCIRNKRMLTLFESFDYHRLNGVRQKEEQRKGIRIRGDFHFFHTIEFILLVGIIGIFFVPFTYIFIGLVFHSALDIVKLIEDDYIYRREFLFSKWLGEKIKRS